MVRRRNKNGIRSYDVVFVSGTADKDLIQGLNELGQQGMRVVEVKKRMKMKYDVWRGEYMDIHDGWNVLVEKNV